MPNPRQLLIDGVRTLLVQEDNGTVRVAQYTANEMLECFNSSEIARLANGEHVEQPVRIGIVRYTDMVACTLLALQVQL